VSSYPSPRPSRAHIASLFLVLVAGIVLAAPGVVHARHTDPPHLAAFMWAIGEVESGGDYTARNRRSGAYGRYQMLPRYWGAWAERYLGDDDARPSRHNQDRVAQGKFRDLYRKLGSWEAVAHAWLTGSDERDPDRWSRGSKRYVRKVMARFREAVREGRAVASSGRSARPSGTRRVSPTPVMTAPAAVAVPRTPVTPPARSTTSPPPPHSVRPPAAAGKATPPAHGVRSRWTTRPLWVRTAPGRDGRRLRRIEPGTRLGIVSGWSTSTSGTPAIVVTLPDGSLGWLLVVGT
jgi:hypothetical protein